MKLSVLGVRAFSASLMLAAAHTTLMHDLESMMRLKVGQSHASAAVVSSTIGISISSYGGSTNISDNSEALLSAVTAHPCDTILVPAGVFNFSSAVNVTMHAGPCSLSIVGAGQGPGGTTLNFNNGSSGLTFVWKSYFNSIHVRNMLVATTSAGGANVGLAVVNQRDFPAPAYAPVTQNDISYVTFQGTEPQNAGMYWGTAVHVININYNKLDTVFVYGGGDKGQGFLLGEPGGVIVGDTKIVSCSLINLDVCVETYNNPQGVIISSSTLIDSNIGLKTRNSNPWIEGLQIINCNLANRDYNIFAHGMINDLQLTGNLFITNDIASGAEVLGYSIYFESVAGFTITGNDFFVSPVLPTANTTAIYINNTNNHPGIISGNIFKGPYKVGIHLDKGTNDIVAYPNAYGPNGPVAKFIDSGSRNILRPSDDV